METSGHKYGIGQGKDGHQPEIISNNSMIGPHRGCYLLSFKPFLNTLIEDKKLPMIAIT
jgi:hypothetical protein